MEPFYSMLFMALATVCLGLETFPFGMSAAATALAAQPRPPAFTAFRNNYLVVYSLMMGARAVRTPGGFPRVTRAHHPAAGDWLQGPYVYALYAAYGFSQADIGKLFIAGFGSSMVFGTVVGSLGDK